MKKHIKLLLLALGFGLNALYAYNEDGSCPTDPCDDLHNPPEYCNNDDDDGDGDSMPEGVIIDDMPTSVFAKE
jgi:hypothetical protein